MRWLKKKLRRWLEIETAEYRISTIEDLIMHGESKLNGFAVLKPEITGKPIMFGGKLVK